MLEMPSLITSRGRRLLFLRPVTHAASRVMPLLGRTPSGQSDQTGQEDAQQPEALLRPARLVPPLPAPLGPALVKAMGTMGHPVAPSTALASVLSRQQGLAHDTRNALCSLQLLVGFLREPGILNPEHHHALDSLEAVGATLGQLLQQATEPAGAPPSHALPVHTMSPVRTTNTAPALDLIPSAGDSVQACTPMLRAIAGPSVQVHISSEHALPPLTIPAENLQRVLMNLVKNATEAMPKGGSVRITARRALSRAQPAVLIHVSDDGEGIPQHALTRIFEPGFSSKSARTAGEPCGLGLAIVRELVEAVGGAVQVASTRHRGTTFELRLPTLAAAASPTPTLAE